MSTAKIFETGAFRPEAGLAGVGQSKGWGSLASSLAPTGECMLPWTSFGNELTIKTTEDDSIVGAGFQNAPVITGETVDNPLNFYTRFYGLDYFWYWAFGFEHRPKEVVVFESTTGWTGVPTPGNLFVSDVSTQSLIYLRTIETKDTYGETKFLYIFENVDFALSTAGTDNIMDEANPSTIYLTVTAHNPEILYQHAYEVDGSARHFREYTHKEMQVINRTISITLSAASTAVVDEIITINPTGAKGKVILSAGNNVQFNLLSGFVPDTAGSITCFAGTIAFPANAWTNAVKLVTNKRNLMCTFAKRMSEYDIKYPNGMCNSWNFNVQAEKLATLETKFLAYTQQRSADASGYGSSDWTLANNLADNDNIPAHFQYVVKLGDTIANMKKICATDFSVKCDTPFQQIQTTCSHKHIAEPILNGKTSLTTSITIARSETQLYQNFRQAQNRLIGSFIATLGFNTQEFYMRRIILSKANPDDGDVASEPLEGTIIQVPKDDDKFASVIGDINLVHNSPVVLVTINGNSNYSMMGV